MLNPTNAAYLYSVLMAFVVLFQIALALGAPWGELAMSGKFPGRFPPRMRVAALVQAVVLIFIALIVLARAGVTLNALFDFSKVAIWGVVAFNLLSAILNSITPSKKERRLWAPITIVLFLCSLYIALN